MAGRDAITIAGLHVYPVKSCRGVAVTDALLGAAGLEYDREWMVVTPEGRFVTQRDAPRLARVAAGVGAEALTLSAAGAGGVSVPLNLRGAATAVTVWRDRCRALDQGEDAARWLGEFVGRGTMFSTSERGGSSWRRMYLEHERGLTGLPPLANADTQYGGR